MGEGKVKLKAGENISIQLWEKPDGTPVIPVFSSQRREPGVWTSG
ncbi:hypothetical protein F385_4291 [Pantoea agglomerans 299R]|nr:hypothetical protein F385_4291 [Pantoea agglomerans 299R]